MSYNILEKIGVIMRIHLLLLGLLLFTGCSFQALVVDQKSTLERIKKIEYDFSLVKTAEEKRELLQNINIMHYSLHKVRELNEASYLKKEILNQLEYDKIYNGLEQLTKYYAQDMKLFSKALLVANDALYFANLNLKRDKNYETVVRAYSNISMVYRESKEYAKALKYINISIGRAKKTLKKNSIVLANSYYQKSMISFFMKNYKNSIRYLKKSIKIAESLEENKRVNLMVFYDQLYKSYKANHEEYKVKQSLDKISKIVNSKVSRPYTKEEKVVIASEIERVNNNILKMQQDVEQFGVSKYRKKDYLNAYNHMYNYSIFFRKQWKFPKALKLAKSSLFFANILSNNRESTLKIKSYNMLSLLNLDMEDYSNALDYVKRAIDASTKILDKKAPLRADSYRTEALIYRSMSQYPQAIKSIKKAISITNAKEDKKILLTLEKDTPKSKKEEITFSWDKLKILKNRLFQIKKVYGEYHYKTANIYSEIAQLYLSAMQIEKAITYARESHKINKKIFGEKSFKTVDSALLLSNIYLVTYNKEKAYMFAKESVESILESRKSLFLELTPNAKLEIKKFKIDYFMLLAYYYIENSVLDDKEIDKVSKEVFNIWLKYKNEISNQESYLVALKAKNRDYTIKSKIDSLIKIKKEYSELFLKRLSKPELFSKDEEKRIIKLKEKKDDLEVYLSSKISEYKDSLHLENVNSFNISQKLNKGELYIDFAYIKDNDSYFSFILNHKGQVIFDIVNPADNNFTKDIKSIFEFTFNAVFDSIDFLLGLPRSSSKKEDNSYVPITTLVKAIRDNIIKKKGKNSFNKTNAKKLYRVLFYENYNLNIRGNIVSDAKKLIISPDGILNLLPFEVLIDRDKYLIEDKKIIYVTSGKEFLKAYQQKNSLNTSNDIVVLSYLDYDNSEGLIKSKNSIEIKKSVINDGQALEKLTDTKNEAETIKKIFTKNNVRSYSQKSGTKELLNSLNSPKILHLSTHSFYGEDNRSCVDSLLKSGIALSGYNNYISKLDTRGIMTALEFSNLNLYQTELVMFSSCQSGRGDIYSSEGVYGLNKGAKLAGAKRVISTLWSVASKESLELTNRFYEHLNENNMKGYSDALRETKLEMIKKGYHPFFWAGFVENGID